MGKMFFQYLSGLGNLPEREPFYIEFENDFVLLNRMKIKLFGSEIIQQYKINAADILAFGIVKTEELQKKSVAGRSVAGGLLLGPVGAVIGGMSAANQKKIKETLAITYLPSTGGEPNTIVLNVDVPSWTSTNRLIATKVGNAVAKIPKSKRVMEYLGQTVNDDGSITL